MWAAVRLSLTSAVCVPVTSILKIVAVNVIEVMAVFKRNEAVPNDAGLGAPALVVGTVGGFSCALVRFANNRVSAKLFVPANSIPSATRTTMKKRYRI